MVQSLLAEHVEHGAAGAGLWIGRGEDNPGDPRQDDRSRTHRAGLQRHVEGGLGQPPSPEPLRARPEGEDLGVGRRITAELPFVRGLGDHLAIANQHRPDRDILVSRRGGRDRQRKSHEIGVAHQSFVVAITIEAKRQTIRIAIATIHERGMDEA